MLAPAEIVTLVTCVAPFRNTPAVEVLVRLIVCPPAPATAALPYVSSICTVIVPEATPAVSTCAAVVMRILLAAAGATVSSCVAEVRPANAAVKAGEPARVSLYVKLAVLLPAEMVTLVTCGGPLKNSPASLVVRLTVWPPPPALTALP